jgi:hypothetical protein
MRGGRVAAWLSSLPLMVAGSQVAHVLAYRWVYPNAHVRLGELLATGHSYMGSEAYLPMLLGMIFAAELVGLGGLLVAGVTRRPQRPVAAWAFALLPILAFTLQELLERWLLHSSFPWWMVLQPTFRVGLLLQLPFALTVYLCARLLLRGTVAVGRGLRGSLPPAHATRRRLGWIVVEACSAAPELLAGGHAGRGPPGVLAAAAPRGR